jgi:hypothetical protein
VPAEESFRADKDRSPGWPRECPGECGEQEPVGGFPGGLADLALENEKLMAERQKLG